MKPLDDNALNQLLNTLHTAPMPEGFAARIANQALACPQDRSFLSAFQDYMADVFGTPWASPPFNLPWRLAGIAAVVLIGFSLGYYDSPPDAEEYVEMEMYGIEEPEWVSAI